MTIRDLSRARPHDLGGQAGGPIERHAHEADAWHNLVTAILYILRDEPHRLIRIDEMRRAIEDMPPEDYRRLGYFEKWAVGVSAILVEKGLMTRAEIDRRMAALGARAKTNEAAQ